MRCFPHDAPWLQLAASAHILLHMSLCWFRTRIDVSMIWYLLTCSLLWRLMMFKRSETLVVNIRKNRAKKTQRYSPRFNITSCLTTVVMLLVKCKKIIFYYGMIIVFLKSRNFIFSIFVFSNIIHQQSLCALEGLSRYPIIMLREVYTMFIFIAWTSGRHTILPGVRVEFGRVGM